MSNLELQKIDREAGKGKEDDSPSADAVIQHIFKITSNRKLSHFSQLRDPKPLSQASNNVTTQNSDVVDAEGICEQVKIELIKYSISQEVFAKAVLGKSQGYLSEMLKHGESFFRPQDHTHYKGWLNFETMRQFLQKPEAERLQIYYQKGEELKMERLKRRQLEVVSSLMNFVSLLVTSTCEILKFSAVKNPVCCKLKIIRHLSYEKQNK